MPRIAMPRLALPSFLRQRIWLFVLLGGALFVLASWGERQARYVIALDAPLRARLAAQWAGQAARPPEAEEMRALLQEHIREEVLVREAKARGLDSDDVIVRRRLAQKMDYLLAAQVEPPGEPSEQQLREFFASHAARYAVPARISFRQVPFDLIEQGDIETERRALVRTLRTRPDAWRDVGEPSMLPRAWVRRDLEDVRRNFGDDFADALQGLAERRAAQNREGAWEGPIESTYGDHFVQIQDYTPGRAVASFDAVRSRLRQDWQSAALEQRKNESYEALRQNYLVLP